MRNSKLLIFLFMILTGIPGLNGQTYVPAGYVCGTWPASGSPYHVQGDIEIHYDSALLIEPGTEVYFDGSYKLTVHGLLNASGTETDSILFTAADTAIGWKGIEFIQINESLGTSYLNYCILSHGNKASGSGGVIYIYQSDEIVIDHCLIKNNYARYDAGGIYINNGWISVKNCIITQNKAIDGAGGIFCISSVPYFYNLQITHNTADMVGGIYFALNPNFSYPFFENLFISNNKGGTCGGLMVEASRTLVLNYCKICSNEGTICGGIMMLYSSLGIWEPWAKSQVYMNYGGVSQELYYEGDESTYINIDTFTVINPDEYLVYPLDKFNFSSGIQSGIIDQLDTNLYISVNGSDTNTGFSPDNALHSFDYALRKMISDAENNNTLWVLPGQYLLNENNAGRPIYFKNHVRIKSTVPHEVILDADSLSRVFYLGAKIGFELSGVTVQNGFVDHIPGTNWVDQVSGGGMCLHSSSGLIDSCIFLSNSTTNFGGGIYVGGNYYVDINNCEFLQNDAGIGGGGLFNDGESGSELALSNCKFIENNSGEEGGGLTSDGTITIRKCEFIENSCTSSGAACYFSEFSRDLVNCLFINNIAGNKGGAVYLNGGNTARITNCTFSDNQALSGTAIYQFFTAKIYSTNNIFWNSSFPINDMIHIYGNGGANYVRFYINYSDIQGGDSAFVLEGFYAKNYWQDGNIDVKPEFIDPDNSDYSLNWNSPCIEAGKEDTTGLYLPLYDLNGNPRIINSRVDMGAYEYQYPVSIPAPQNPSANILINHHSSQSNITVRFPEDLYHQKLIINLMASDGRILQSRVKSERVVTVQLNTSGISPGLYLVATYDLHGIIDVGKILVAH